MANKSQQAQQQQPRRMSFLNKLLISFFSLLVVAYFLAFYMDATFNSLPESWKQFSRDFQRSGIEVFMRQLNND